MSIEKAQSRVRTYNFPPRLVLVNKRVNKSRGSGTGRGTNSATYSAAIWTWISAGGWEHRRRATQLFITLLSANGPPLLDAYKHEERR